MSLPVVPRCATTPHCRHSHTGFKLHAPWLSRRTANPHAETHPNLKPATLPVCIPNPKNCGRVAKEPTNSASLNTCRSWGCHGSHGLQFGTSRTLWERIYSVRKEGPDTGQFEKIGCIPSVFFYGTHFVQIWDPARL